MRFIFVGGGTGGHLTPAIGLAEGLEARGHETLFLLSGRDVEQSYVADGRACISLAFESSRFPRPLALIGAGRRARKHAGRFRPDAVIALGGAASAASLAIPHAPLVLLEGNYVVGRSVKWMSSFSALILTMFEPTAKQLKRATAIGPVTRKVLEPQDVATAREQFGLDPQRKTILVMGGSQGAKDLNNLAQSLLPELDQAEWQMLAICGAGKGEALEACGYKNLVVLDHCDAMGAAYSAADFALTRGGASTVGELWLHGLPAAVLPYPWHQDRQQEHNARALEPGLLCLNGTDPKAHLASILACLQSDSQRQKMRDSLAAQRPPDGQAIGVAQLEEIATPKH
ncbi:MAG: UDP-N-acetylglucosamine--N-acetylmuramyl-(pentapeptide) pyrophosphoryl-undecaprenol N-acetylglucosamine transferase [Planctomycetota bacterium]|nr:UDP-N-acetylglucosamine--N-acetylmuramyl-(pentapeptide) pyrophosphoryl-undecaprenol N-acetylglucosamine transferase [Planctomycetota bacterium]MDA1114445.1 UDP-N-acetylglucosamine--N-acetylmuramyl-(pentapeptide) pyrophosphoryl-undecaprenol N-acetylglucosamine transferase [Planctomycetota bacterium]